MRVGGWALLAVVAVLGAIQSFSLTPPVDRQEERAAQRATLPSTSTIVEPVADSIRR